MANLRVLIVDDEKPQRDLVGGALEKQGYKVTRAGSADEAIAAADKTFFEIALLDIRMPGRSGLDLLGELKSSNPDLQAIMVSAHGTFETGLEAMKKGAFDFLKKPIDLEQLMVVLRRAGERHWLLAENRYLMITTSFGAALFSEPGRPANTDFETRPDSVWTEEDYRMKGLKAAHDAWQ